MIVRSNRYRRQKLGERWLLTSCHGRRWHHGWQGRQFLVCWWQRVTRWHRHTVWRWRVWGRLTTTSGRRRAGSQRVLFHGRRLRLGSGSSRYNVNRFQYWDSTTTIDLRCGVRMASSRYRRYYGDGKSWHCRNQLIVCLHCAQHSHVQRSHEWHHRVPRRWMYIGMYAAEVRTSTTAADTTQTQCDRQQAPVSALYVARTTVPCCKYVGHGSVNTYRQKYRTNLHRIQQMCTISNTNSTPDIFSVSWRTRLCKFHSGNQQQAVKI